MSVKASLEGLPSDLESLSELFREGDPRIGKDGDIYYLISTHFDDLFDDSRRLLDTASRLLVRSIGIARALGVPIRKVVLGGKYVDDDGSGMPRRRQIHQLEAAVERSTARRIVLVVDGSPQVEKPQGPEFNRAAVNSPEVAEVFEIFGRGAIPGLDWVDLYKIFEIVRHHAGGERALLAKAWVSKGEISAFKGSANLPEVSGGAARHARTTGGVPKQTMTLAEGRSFVRKIAAVWCNSLDYG